jgi:hypothetical protein
MKEVAVAEEDDGEEMSAGLKVAILMISLGQETTAEVMKYLSDIEIERIAQNIAELDVVTTEQEDMVLEEFEQMLIAGQYVSQGGMEFARGALEKAMGWATFNGHTDVVKVLLKAGADVNRRNRAGNTSVIYAASKGHSDILELFIRMNADLLPRAQSDLTLLVAAARSGHSEAVRLLLNSDQAHLQRRDSALRAAKRRGHRSVVHMITSFVRVASVE